ncbi:GNAT family N-acetyltransferase [Roseococcus sp.]|uniref:GNAT family N-acetyltransferase n=1 Tax=Roseococcus sp. TaxID=2109646 RepID=UPI003BAABAB4
MNPGELREPVPPTIEVRLFQEPEDLARCFEALDVLHPGRLDPADFTATLTRMVREPGVRVAGIEEGPRVLACVVFRVAESLSYGRHVSIEEIATVQDARARGLGRILMDHVRDHGRAEGCASIHLNSGLGRAATRRFYHRYGMDISSFHFKMEI